MQAKHHCKARLNQQATTRQVTTARKGDQPANQGHRPKHNIHNPAECVNTLLTGSGTSLCVAHCTADSRLQQQQQHLLAALNSSNAPCPVPKLAPTGPPCPNPAAQPDPAHSLPKPRPRVQASTPAKNPDLAPNPSINPVMPYCNTTPQIQHASLSYLGAQTTKSHNDTTSKPGPACGCTLKILHTLNPAPMQATHKPPATTGAPVMYISHRFVNLVSYTQTQT
jgi:hypothetical protein